MFFILECFPCFSVLLKSIIMKLICCMTSCILVEGSGRRHYFSWSVAVSMMILAYYWVIFQLRGIIQGSKIVVLSPVSLFTFSSVHFVYCMFKHTEHRKQTDSLCYLKSLNATMLISKAFQHVTSMPLNCVFVSVCLSTNKQMKWKTILVQMLGNQSNLEFLKVVRQLNLCWREQSVIPCLANERQPSLILVPF